jgi:HEXXH motif-containing protein
MTVRYHTVPRELFRALASGGGGPDAVRELVMAQRSKHLILLTTIAKAARSGTRPDDGLGLAGYELLARAQRANPLAAQVVMGYPSVGAWALQTHRALRGDQALPGTRPSGLAAVAAAAAIRAGLDAEIEAPVINGAVVLPSLGAVQADDDTIIIRTRPAAFRVGGQWMELRPGAPCWQEIRGAQAGALRVLIDDVDPFRMPATDGAPTGRLADAQVAELTAMLRDAWEILPPASAAEIAAIVTVIVPFQGPESGHVSTSSPQTFGTVAMSRQPDPYTCAETLVHETQHLKLCALLDIVPLTRPDDGERYYAPWRTDPRPAGGLLQGAYAFLGVSGFWRRLRGIAPGAQVRLRAESEFARWRDGAALAADTLLSSGQLTAAGQAFVGEMIRVLSDWQRESVASDALAVARRKAERHLAQWHADNG